MKRQKEMGNGKSDIGDEARLCTIVLTQSGTGSPFIPRDVSKPSLLLASFGVKRPGIWRVIISARFLNLSGDLIHEFGISIAYIGMEICSLADCHGFRE